MTTPKAEDVRKGIAVLWETLQCPICLELMTAPVSTKCDHQFCKFCITKLLDNSKPNRATCPVCKSKITKRSLQESPGFQRLVAGLQDMIQAYEHDTSTNYFTGLPQERMNANITDRETSKHAANLSSGNTFGTDLNNLETTGCDDHPQSCSSTAAALNGFAQLMGLEDSVSVTAENEGLDGRLCDIPPASDRKTSNSADHLETENVGKNASSSRSKPENSDCLKPTQEETVQQPVRKSSRKKQKKEVDPEKVDEQKKKKSLEKVAEWLLKVPAKEELELENPPTHEDDEDSCSSASTLDLVPQNDELNPKKDDRAKGLEEQVFGAVYKRRGNKVIEPLTAKERKNIKRVSKKSNLLHCEEKQVENEISGDFYKPDVKEKPDGSVEQLKNLSESDKNQPEASPPKRRTRKNMQQLQVEPSEQTDLKSEGREEKGGSRKARKSNSNRKKPTKEAESAVLLEFQNSETSPKPNERSEKVVVQIETYPSSEEQKTPVMSSARRSRRLQLFAEEDQENRSAKKLTEDTSDEAMDAVLPKSGNLPMEAKRNGCIYEEDIGGIESAENSGRASLRQTEAEVPEAQTPPKAAADCPPSVVPNSTSPSLPSVVGPTLDSEKQEMNYQHDSQQEISVNEAKRKVEESEDCRNDSELDTEQLLRTFKAAKRKSFCLGEPNVKRSRGLDDAATSDAGSELSENVGEVLKVTGKLVCSDVIPPSDFPDQKKPDQSVLEASDPNSKGSVQEDDAEYCPIRSSFSSGLSPNKVSRRDRDSPQSVVPQVIESGLCFMAVERDAPRSSQVASSLKEIRDGVSNYPSFQDASLTPDILEIHKADLNASVSGEVSTPSSVKMNPKKKRRTQKLDSSSESGSSDSKEEFPALAHIFGVSNRPQTEARDQEEMGETSRGEGVCGETDGAEPLSRPPGSPSPDQVHSSQASVDLFGTPAECDAPENDAGISIESSEFSSEVPVTQQKIEMQKELVRLEKLIALVSEVLQEKEGSPAREGLPSESDQGGKDRGPDVPKPLPNDQDPVQPSDREDFLDAEKRPSDDKVVAKQGSVSESAVNDSSCAALQVKGTKVRSSTPATKTVINRDLPPDGQEDKENNSPPKDRPKPKLVLVTSGLGPNEQIMVKKFAKRLGGHVVPQVTPEVTHVIMRTDDQLVCERTLKYFLGIAGRKWVVSFLWISECFKEKKLLEESSFEVRGDVVNGPNHQGPLRARTTQDSDLLLKGYTICLKGPFTDMSTDDMQWMVELCGATVVKDPLLLDGKQKSHHIIIVQPRANSSSSLYSSLSRKATVVSRGWLLDTVATYTLQKYSSYTV
ncbi:breast cancer type 1 susceptibility protein-like [Cyprinodon tularosa]|uniref:breast cancer type 1 susceptibility protein-like n=1 Tax=Cyprinodon tularosa TaxID=77115 RepID=UPI0018E27313|nr:breast cancer type 1 susceptibility protein-like [Cyprinodon tularosa]